MKITCDKCGDNISYVVSRNFEENKIGNYVCDKCGYKQKRYISETDLLIYLAFQEIVYFILSFITSILFNTYKISVPIVLILLVMLTIAIVATNYFKSFIYNNAPLKKSTKYKAKNDNQDKIAKSIRWQFLMFFALVITFFTEVIAYWFFVFASLVVIITTIIKAILSAKNE